MTPLEFRGLQGEPTTWSTADFDSYTVLTETASLAPYGADQLAAVANSHLEAAQRQSAVAGTLLDDGHLEAADLWKQGAKTSYAFAAAAQKGWPQYEAALNGW
jgi:hypothetical protein